MKDGFVKIAALSPELRVANCGYNAERIIGAASEAAEAGAKVIVFPELSVTGYTCGDLFGQDALIAAAKSALGDILDGTSALDALIVVGLPIAEIKLYNCAAVLCRGELLGLVPKTHLPNYAEFYEARNFSPAPEHTGTVSFRGRDVPFGTKLLFACRELPELVAAVEICEDLWVPTPPSDSHAVNGASLICNISASDETVGKRDYRRRLVSGQSASLFCAYVYADAGRGESTTDMVFAGHDIIAENGVILAEAAPFGAGKAVSEPDFKRLAFERRRVNSFPAPNDDGYKTVYFSLRPTETVLTRAIDPTPFVPASAASRAERCEDVLSIQANGFAKRLQHTRCRSAVIGISGGLDSCLALLVAVRAFDLLGLPRDGVTAVTMPCFGTTARTKSNAVALCEQLGVSLRTIEIAKAVRQHFADIGHDEADKSVVFENSQARERTQVLMDIANGIGALVVGTGDLSELALGWATYNGDHMSMYGVNAGVPKTLVRHIVGYIADTCGDDGLAATLRDILATPVSPELLPAENGDIAQKTEELVGPYELHDFILYNVVRCGCAPGKVYRLLRAAFAEKYPDEVLLRWLRSFYRRFFSQQFKRSCLPDGPKVGSVTLSPRGDWRMPSDADAALWLAEVDSL